MSSGDYTTTQQGDNEVGNALQPVSGPEASMSPPSQQHRATSRSPPLSASPAIILSRLRAVILDLDELLSLQRTGKLRTAPSVSPFLTADGALRFATSATKTRSNRSNHSEMHLSGNLHNNSEAAASSPSPSREHYHSRHSDSYTSNAPASSPKDIGFIAPAAQRVVQQLIDCDMMRDLLHLITDSKSSSQPEGQGGSQARTKIAVDGTPPTDVIVDSIFTWVLVTQFLCKKDTQDMLGVSTGSACRPQAEAVKKNRSAKATAINNNNNSGAGSSFQTSFRSFVAMCELHTLDVLEVACKLLNDLIREEGETRTTQQQQQSNDGPDSQKQRRLIWLLFGTLRLLLGCHTVEHWELDPEVVFYLDSSTLQSPDATLRQHQQQDASNSGIGEASDFDTARRMAWLPSATCSCMSTEKKSLNIPTNASFILNALMESGLMATMQRALNDFVSNGNSDDDDEEETEERLHQAWFVSLYLKLSELLMATLRRDEVDLLIQQVFPSAVSITAVAACGRGGAAEEEERTHSAASNTASSSSSLRPQDVPEGADPSTTSCLLLLSWVLRCLSRSNRPEAHAGPFAARVVTWWLVRSAEVHPEDPSSAVDTLFSVPDNHRQSCVVGIAKECIRRVADEILVERQRRAAMEEQAIQSRNRSRPHNERPRFADPTISAASNVAASMKDTEASPGGMRLIPEAVLLVAIVFRQSISSSSSSSSSVSVWDQALSLSYCSRQMLAEKLFPAVVADATAYLHMLISTTSHTNAKHNGVAELLTVTTPQFISTSVRRPAVSQIPHASQTTFAVEPPPAVHASPARITSSSVMLSSLSTAERDAAALSSTPQAFVSTSVSTSIPPIAALNALCTDTSLVMLQTPFNTTKYRALPSLCFCAATEFTGNVHVPPQLSVVVRGRGDPSAFPRDVVTVARVQLRQQSTSSISRQPNQQQHVPDFLVSLGSVSADAHVSWPLPKDCVLPLVADGPLAVPRLRRSMVEIFLLSSETPNVSTFMHRSPLMIPRPDTVVQQDVFIACCVVSTQELAVWMHTATAPAVLPSEEAVDALLWGASPRANYTVASAQQAASSLSLRALSSCSPRGGVHPPPQAAQESAPPLTASVPSEDVERRATTSPKARHPQGESYTLDEQNKTGEAEDDDVSPRRSAQDSVVCDALRIALLEQQRRNAALETRCREAEEQRDAVTQRMIDVRSELDLCQIAQVMPLRQETVKLRRMLNRKRQELSEALGGMEIVTQQNAQLAQQLEHATELLKRILNAKGIVPQN